MLKRIHRLVAEVAFAIAAATLPVLASLGVLHAPVPVRVRVTEKRR